MTCVIFPLRTANSVELASLVKQEESWTSDPNAFIADKDDEMVSYNVRGSAIDFVTVSFRCRPLQLLFLTFREAQSLVDTFELKTLGAMWSAFERMAGDCDAARSRSDEDWFVLAVAIALTKTYS